MNGAKMTLCVCVCLLFVCACACVCVCVCVRVCCPSLPSTVGQVDAFVHETRSDAELEEKKAEQIVTSQVRRARRFPPSGLLFPAAASHDDVWLF